MKIAVILVSVILLLLALSCGDVAQDCEKASEMALDWQRQGYDEEQINYLLMDTEWRDVYEFYEFLQFCDNFVEGQ